MLDDVSDIRKMYNGEAEHEDDRLERHRLEHDMTWRYLEQYLPPDGAILEVGAATGRYTLELARRGYRVTAVDFSEKLLSICRGRLEEAGLGQSVICVEADARDLSTVGQKDFDAALLMGPLYHLVLEEDRVLALKQAQGLLKSGGLIFTAWISRFGVLGDLMKNLPEWIEEKEVPQSLLKKGRRPDSHPRGGFRGYFTDVSEIAPLHERAGFQTLALAAVEPAISADDDAYNRLSGERRRAWLDVLFKVSTEPSCLGASRHLLYVGRKSSGEISG
jgi:ubiquinone/menaquinone biosynthesis C-methylase UbiE